jgi:hypothetical protein
MKTLGHPSGSGEYRTLRKNRRRSSRAFAKMLIKGMG